MMYDDVSHDGIDIFVLPQLTIECALLNKYIQQHQIIMLA